MTKQETIARFLETMNRLPVDKAEEISDFADFVRKRHEEQEITKGLQLLVEKSSAFDFRKDEEDICIT